MRVAISGSTGLIGSALVTSLRTDGHEVLPLIRPPLPWQRGHVRWDPETGNIEYITLEGVDAVVHLAGEPIGALRWTSKKRRRIRDSRVRGTTTLAHGLAALTKPPEVLICASATGYFGDRGTEPLDERSAPGSGFLAGVCQEWEAAARPAAEAGVRVVHARLAPVLSSRSPIVRRMRTPVKLGLGCWFGSGRNYWPWIALEDVVGAIRLAIERESLSGPLVVASPASVTHRTFVKTMGRVLRRPVVIRTPARIVRWALGDLAREMLLSSQLVVPRRLLDAGYEFQRPNLAPALRSAFRPD